MSIKNWEEFIKEIPTDVLVSELERRKQESKIELNLDTLAIEIIQETEKALTRFGEYTFGDKGPDEVMNISTISRKLKSKSVKEVATVLTQVLDNYGKISSVGNHRHANAVVNSIICELDDMDWFDELLNSDERFEY